MKRILVVDDDPHLREVLVYALERDGYTVTTAADGKEALDRAEREDFDLVVLDILMPEIDGLEVCRKLRARGRLPILFLSSRDEEIDKVIGLELGGDDYVTKPFSPRELVARVKAVLRRAQMVKDALAGTAAASVDSELCVGPIRLCTVRHEVRCSGELIPLTVTEFGVLSSLMLRPGHVLSRGQLLERAYAYDNLITERTIDTHIKRIRKKFRDAGCDPIETVHGVGYKLRAD